MTKLNLHFQRQLENVVRKIVKKFRNLKFLLINKRKKYFRRKNP
jgi:hypothetical protein